MCCRPQGPSLLSPGKISESVRRLIPLDFAPLSARGGHTNRHSECSPAQGFWPQRQLLLPERCSDLLEQDQKSVCSMLSWSPLTTSRSAPVPETRFCSCTSGRHFRRPLPRALTNLTNWERTTSDAFWRRERPTSSSTWLGIHGPVRPWFST